MNPARLRLAWCGFLQGARLGSLLLVLVGIGQTTLAAPRYQLIKSFGDPDLGGVLPEGRLSESGDGYLYGTTFRGGLNGDGTLYRISADGTGYRVLHQFGGVDALSAPSGHLLEASDGFLYGTTVNSGTSGKGAVFKFDRATNQLAVLRILTGVGQGSVTPRAGLIEGSDGALYGTVDGDVSGMSLVFALNRDGSNYRVLRSFNGSGGTPNWCRTPLCEGSDGMLYGTSFRGGTSDRGALFKLAKDGTGFQVLRSFGTSSSAPSAAAGGVMEGSDGFLYGGLSYGGSNEGGGVIYRISRTGTGFSIIHSFNTSELYEPVGELVEAGDGRLFGAAAKGAPVVGGVFAVRKDGSGFTRLPFSDIGQSPSTGLIFGGDGRLYGVGLGEGSSTGLLYRTPTAGPGLTVIHRFTPSGGESPGPLTLTEGRDKWLYGTTEGNFDLWPSFFKIRRDGSGFAPLRSFVQEVPFDGKREPSGPLTQAVDGLFYGGSYHGGTRGGGAVIQISASGEEYEFVTEFGNVTVTGPSQASQGVLLGSDGLIYGATTRGGTDREGTVYRVAPDGSGLTILHSFAGGIPDGRNPPFAPIEGRDGRLYGGVSDGIYSLNRDGTGYSYNRLVSSGTFFPEIMEASDGLLYWVGATGGSENGGAIYKSNRDGSGFATVYSFSPAGTGPYTPHGAVVEGPGGLLYGVTHKGGTANDGVLYGIARSGEGFEVVHEFDYDAGDGAQANGLIMGADNVIYGTLRQGGAHGFGALFRFGEAPEISIEYPPGVSLASEGETIDLGNVEFGGTKVIKLVVRNSGELPLELLGFAFEGPNAADFSVVTPAPISVAPDGFTEIEVRFRPLGGGLKSGTLHVTSDDYDEGVFAISFTALVPTPEIAVHDGATAAAPELLDGQAAAVDFGIARQGTPAVRDFTIVNTGAAPLSVTGLTVPPGYTAPALPALPTTVAINQSLTLQIRIEAATLGRFVGSITITNDDPDEAAFDFPVTGTVVTPEIALHDGKGADGPELADGQVPAVDFGRNVQGTPRTRTFTIANTGTAELLVSSVAVPTGYEVSGLPALPFTVGLNGSVAFQISLTTLVVGTHAGSVAIGSDDVDETLFDFPVTGEVFIPNPESAVVSASTAVNRQTGLREQAIHVTNDTTATVPAYDLIIRGLPAGVEVFNASATRADGSVVVHVVQSMGPHTAQDMVIEYYSPDRQPGALNPQVSTEVVLNPPDTTVPTGDGTLSTDRVIRLPNGEMLIEFTSVPGRLYQIQYSNDGGAWKDSLTRVRAAGNRTQWIDRGPPRTDSTPGRGGSRLYRVKDATP